MPANPTPSPQKLMAEPAHGWAGAPLVPVNDNPMLDGIGPGAWADRADVPDLDFEGRVKIVPLRAAPHFQVSAKDRDPRGLPVVGADGEVGGTVVELWVDMAESLFRYLELEISGGARNVYAERCEMRSPNLDRGLRIKTNSKRGGVIENVFVRDIEIGDVQLGPIDITMRYEPQDTGPYLPVVRNIRVERMTSNKSGYALFVQALDDSPVRGLLVRDSVFRGVEKGSLLEGLVDIVLENVTVEPRKK